MWLHCRYYPEGLNGEPRPVGMRYRSRACQSIGCLWNTVAKSLVTTHRHRHPTPKMGKKEDPYPLVPWENLMVVAAMGLDVDPLGFP